MVQDVNTILTIGYISIQVIITILVSIIGAVHVRIAIQAASEMEPQSDITNATGRNDTHTLEISIDDHTDKKRKTICEIWVKTAWKMRSVYSALAVHSFDVLTDVLVIVQWLETPDEEGDHINPQYMAYCAIADMVLSKILSCVAIYLKEQDIVRCILQFFDLLIFQEIFEAHKKIVSRMKSKKLKDKNTAIESTLSFKYVRQMEAVFESIPESILQLVYVMRTSTIEPIFVVSIVQSVISMTNSILNHDYTRMQDDKWKKYKQRLPPTFPFLKHAVSRLAEITYRISLLALLWTVCGGLSFGIIVAIELLVIVIRNITLYGYNLIEFNADTILLSLSSLIVIPSEEVYGEASTKFYEWFGCPEYGHRPAGNPVGYYCFITSLNILCCIGMTACFASLGTVFCNLCCSKDEKFSGSINAIPLTRMSTSFMELMFLILWSFLADNGERNKYLLSVKHGLSIFIVAIVSFLIYSQYMILFPNFSLPMNINTRSKWAYAYSSEWTELNKLKIKLPQTRSKVKFSGKPKEYGHGFWFTRIDEDYEIKDEPTYWDEPLLILLRMPIMTAAFFALANDDQEIVSWLESKGALEHKGFDCALAKHILTLFEDKRMLKTVGVMNVDLNKVVTVLRERLTILVIGSQFHIAMHWVKHGITVDEQDCKKLLQEMSQKMTTKSMSVYWLQILKHIMETGEKVYLERRKKSKESINLEHLLKQVDKSHRIYPLESEVLSGGNLIHLAVAINLIKEISETKDDESILLNPANFSTNVLKEVLQEESKNVLSAINSKNFDGDTALHCVVKRSSYQDVDIENVKLLLAYTGIDVMKKNDSDQTVYDIIEMKSKTDNAMNVSKMKNVLDDAKPKGFYYTGTAAP